MNHRRSTSRRRRGSAGGRRGSRRKRAAQALTAGAAIAAGTQAYGAPVTWDNPAQGEPGHFDWGVSGAATGLDIMQGAGSQPAGGSAPSVFEQYVQDADVFGVVYAPVGGGVEVGGHLDWYLVPQFASDYGGWGIGVPSGAAWRYLGLVYQYDASPPSLLPEGVRVYLGVRFDPGDGVHYGWLGVVREAAELDAFAWGYETEAGAPIWGLPEPGTLSMLAFGAALVGSRRR